MVEPGIGQNCGATSRHGYIASSLLLPLVRFLCPALAVQLLKRYGIFLHSQGRGLYELRHILVLAQQSYPSLRQEMAPAWQIVKHRQPLQEILFRAMFSVAVCWGWKRFATLLLLGMGRDSQDWRIVEGHTGGFGAAFRSCWNALTGKGQSATPSN